MQEAKEKRYSNFELLRLFAIFGIILYHITCYYFSDFSSNIFINNLWFYFTGCLGQTGVSLFVLITGYFLIDRKKSVVTRLIKIQLQVFSYSVVISFSFFIIKRQPMNLRQILGTIFPITFNRYWFVTCYYILVLLSPFYNHFLNTISQNKYKAFLLLTFIIWYCTYTFLNARIYANEFILLMVLYAIGGYLKKYGDNFRIKKYTWGLISLFLIVFFVAGLYVFDRFHIERYSSNLYPRFDWLTGLNSAFILVISLSIFMFFIKIKKGYVRIINFTSQATFGIYLIHSNSIVSLILWGRIFHLSRYNNKIYYIPYCLAAGIIVFIGCLVIELVRIYVFEKQYMKLVNKITPWIKRVGYKVYIKLTSFW